MSVREGWDEVTAPAEGEAGEDSRTRGVPGFSLLRQLEGGFQVPSGTRDHKPARIDRLGLVACVSLAMCLRVAPAADLLTAREETTVRSRPGSGCSVTVRVPAPVS